ncbi:uncharacterized protein [Palaemon carinicauda]|uniref:uncharacterized protein n=1 Tax=Palaemon carinicauda TaxID=392227 RepID=UPI0035B60882
MRDFHQPHLQPISVPKFPFERIIIDCVGPMPRTKQGNEYLLTVLCPTTRYPIAVPIKNINAKTIIDQLVKIFTTYGFPKTLQCDRGTNFTSKLFQQAMREFNIHNIYTSAYHPRSNGALERVHQTIKNLLRKYMQETSEQWDRDIDLLMYIIRSVPQESTGVSPFELMFGRKPRTTLSMVKENLIHNKEEEITNILSYLQQLKDKIVSLHVFANTNLLHSQEKMSRLYDKKAKLRVFQPEDEVLVYHPIPGSPLREKFMGPYKVLQRISKVNYVLSTPVRRRSKQLVHVNLLKAYQAPTQMVSHLSISPEAKILPLEESSSELLLDLPEDDQLINWKDNTNSQILKSLPSYFTGIPSSQRKLLSQLLSRFHDVCSDSLQRSQTIQHDIVIESVVTPIRQTYYRMVGKKLDSLKQEVMPFGLTNAPATFQRMMSEVIRNMNDTYVYLDDVVVASDDWDEHLQTLEELFHRFRSSRLTVNLAKSAFGRAKVTYLGHTFGGGSIMPKDVNIASILDYPIPTNKKELKSFLGMNSYYSRFIKNYSEITASLYNLTSPKISFYWEEKHQQLFNNLRRVFISKPLLKAPNFNQDFLLQVDASNSGYGAVLLQMSSAYKSGDEPPLDYLFPVSYFSGSFKGSQIRWATIEKELFAIIAALRPFAPYLECNHKVIVYTYHRPLTFLDRSRLLNDKLLRWSYYLTRYNLELRAILGHQNKIADALSRLPDISHPSHPKHNAANSDVEALRDGLLKLGGWFTKCQIPFKCGECKVMHIGYSNPQSDYSLLDNVTESVDQEEDLSIIIINDWKFTKKSIEA